MEIFLFMTVSASLIIAAALVLRALFGRVLPRGAFMALWCAASLRLLVPLEIALPVSFFSLFVRHETIPVSALADRNVPILTAPSAAAAPTSPPASAAPVIPAVPRMPSAPEPLHFADLLPWIWAAGVVLTVCILLFFHLREKRRCRFMMRYFEAEALTPRFVRVYKCGAVSTPYVTGLLRPQILLPADFIEADLPAVLAHELAHIRGLDILKKYLFAAALCVNWFNPLVWVMVQVASRDLELLCDERALRGADAPSRTAYVHALLNAEEHRSILSPSFNKNNTEVRIMNILKNKKNSRFAAILSVLLVVVLVAACASVPAAQEKEPEVSAVPTSEPAIETLSAESEDPTVALLTENGKFQLGDYKWGLSREEVTEISGGKLTFRFENPPYQLWIGSLPADLFGYSGTLEFSFRQDRLFQIDFYFDSVYGMQENIFNTTLDALNAAFGEPVDTRVIVEGTESESAPAINDWDIDGTRLCLTCDLTAIQKGSWQRIRLMLQDSDFVNQRNEEASANPTPTPSPEEERIASAGFKQQIEENQLEIDLLESHIKILQDHQKHLFERMDALDEYSEQDKVYRQLAEDKLGKNASEYELREEMEFLRSLDQLEALFPEMPDTDGKECRVIRVRRTDTDEVVREFLVPKEDLWDYYGQISDAIFAAVSNEQLSCTITFP